MKTKILNYHIVDTVHKYTCRCILLHISGNNSPVMMSDETITLAKSSKSHSQQQVKNSILAVTIWLLQTYSVVFESLIHVHFISRLHKFSTRQTNEKLRSLESCSIKSCKISAGLAVHDLGKM